MKRNTHALCQARGSFYGLGSFRKDGMFVRGRDGPCVFLKFPFQRCYRRPPDCTNENSRICSCHFIGGLKSAGPSLFKWSENKVSCFATPDKCVKEEPEEKDIMNAQDSPRMPSYIIPFQTSAQEDPSSGGLVDERTMKHFKEEDAERETKPLCW